MEKVPDLPSTRNQRAAMSLPDQAYTYIKERIQQMVYKPGAPLSVADIAAELGMSRTPVREALGRLRCEGLVDLHPRKGHVVFSLTLHDIEEIFDVKEAIEGMIARQAAERRLKDSADRLDSLNREMEEAAAKADHDVWLRADADYHAELFRVVGNRRAADIVAGLADQWYRLRIAFIALEGRMAESAIEHRRITDAIISGDADGADRAMREHLHNLRSTLLSLVKHLVLPYVGENF